MKKIVISFVVILVAIAAVVGFLTVRNEDTTAGEVSSPVDTVAPETETPDTVIEETDAVEETVEPSQEIIEPEEPIEEPAPVESEEVVETTTPVVSEIPVETIDPTETNEPEAIETAPVAEEPEPIKTKQPEPEATPTPESSEENEIPVDFYEQAIGILDAYKENEIVEVIERREDGTIIGFTASGELVELVVPDVDSDIPEPGTPEFDEWVDKSAADLSDKLDEIFGLD